MRRSLYSYFGFVLIAMMLSVSAWAQVAGTVSYLSGTLTAKKTDARSPRLLTEKSEFASGEILATAQDSYARLKFLDGSEIALRPNSSLNVNEVRYAEADPASDSFKVSLLKGGLRAVTGLIGKRNRQNVNVNGLVASIGIRGTHFGMMLCQNDDCQGQQTLGGKPLSNGLYADVADGSTVVSNLAGQLGLEKEHFAYVADANTPPLEVPAEQAFRVRLPASVMFDRGAQLWSDDALCSACVLQ